MKNVLVVMALFETTTGLALLVSPALPVSLLIGATLDAPAGLILGRVAGAALVALGLACWLARDDRGSGAARGVVAAMLVYNAAALGVLLYAGLGLGLSGIALWPAVVLHVALALWCATQVQSSRQLPGPRGSPQLPHAPTGSD